MVTERPRPRRLSFDDGRITAISNERRCILYKKSCTYSVKASAGYTTVELSGRARRLSVSR